MPSKRVVVTPPMLSAFSAAFDPLCAHGMEVVINTGAYPLPEPALIEFTGDAVAAIIGLDKVSADYLAACPGLRMVARNGVGLDNVDMFAATRLGVLVTAPLGANSTSVAELTIGLMIDMVRQVIPHHIALQAGAWERRIGHEVSGKTLGIIGLGRIGQRVALRAQALEMNVIANDIAPDEEFGRSHNIPFVSFADILGNADVLSLHVPLTPLTESMINREALAAMKQGAYLLNTARAGVVDPLALGAALDSGRLAGAAVDVHFTEGGRGASAHPTLINKPNLLTTPHIGGYTEEALERTTIYAVQNIIDALAGRRPAGLINSEVWHG